MSEADHSPGSHTPSMSGPDTSWPPDYDVATRMAELENFWKAGVTPALFDALKHVKAVSLCQGSALDLGRCAEGR
jgi:hypothetical protein